MKLDKARSDAEAERVQAEQNLKNVEAYCDDVVLHEGDKSVKETTFGVNQVYKWREGNWTQVNATMHELHDRNVAEAQRTVDLSQFEVDCHKKYAYLKRACPSDLSQLGPRVRGGGPLWRRCEECGGNPTHEGGKRYCAWQHHRCWEIDFLRGQCAPPEGQPAMCYRSNILDPTIVHAIEAWLDSKNGDADESRTLKESSVVRGASSQKQ